MPPYQAKSTHISALPLTRSSFSPFGDVIEIPPSASRTLFPPPQKANQGTALKYSGISQTKETYHLAPSSSSSIASTGSLARPTATSGKPMTSLFVCSPRKLESSGSSSGRSSKVQGIFKPHILERHPYTTQTFTPLALSSSPNARTRYLVIVAPSLPGDAGPDISNTKAFLATGAQAVTYGVGTWHAPMVVLGDEKVGFVVFQWTSGVAKEDCEEIEIGEGMLEVEVAWSMEESKL